MIYAGMDVHVRNTYFSITDAAGQVLRSARCLNTPAAMAGFLEDFEDQEMRACLESITNSRAIHQMLLRTARKQGITLTAQVLDARQLQVIAESVCKCDRLDAPIINELARSQLKLPVCYLPDDEEFAAREHLRGRADLVRVRTVLKNRVHALLHRRGILIPAGGLFGKAGRTFLAQLELDEAGREILAPYLGRIADLDAVIADSDQALGRLARRERWARSVALLRSMPGIGLITALTILAELGDLSRFRSRAAVANYEGLVPVVRSSDQKRFYGQITRRGPRLLRPVLSEAAWIAIRGVPGYRTCLSGLPRRRTSWWPMSPCLDRCSKTRSPC